MKIMLKSDCPTFDRAQQRPSHQIPDHFKCGEVYTWLCAGELYAVECKLCDDQPLCPLSEFPQHMEIWHTEWHEAPHTEKNYEMKVQHFISGDSEVEVQEAEENSLDNLMNDRALSFTTEDSGLFETDDQLHNARSAKTRAELEEILEPFEQVLIEQDLNVDDDTTLQIGEEVNEEEFVKDVYEPVAAEIKQLSIENRQQQMQIFVKQNLTLANREPLAEDLTVEEREARHLTDARKRNGKSGFYPAENFRNKHEYNKNKSKSETSGSETNNDNYAKTKKFLRELKFKTKSIQQKYSKLHEIKRTLKRIIKDISALQETDKSGISAKKSETSATSAGEISKRNLHSKFSLQRRNLINFFDSETSMKNYFKKITFKTHKIPTKEFAKPGKSKRILRKINRNKIKEKDFIAEPFCETEAIEQCGNETVAIKETKQNCLKENVKGLRNIETSPAEMSSKGKQKCLLANEEESNKTESGIFGNKAHQSENKVETNKKKFQIIAMEQIANETEQCKNETKEIESKTKGIENKISLIKREQDENKTKTIESETKLVQNELFNAKKLRNGKLKGISNGLKTSFKGTNEFGTLDTNLQKRLDSKAKPRKYLTRNQSANAKKKKTETNGNETHFGKDLTKLNLKKYIENKTSKLDHKLCVQIPDYAKGTNGNETNEPNSPCCLKTLTQVNRNAMEGQAETAAYETLENNHDKDNEETNAALTNTKGTNENETYNKVINQRIRKSQRTKRVVKNLLKGKQIKIKAKGTNGIETLENYKTLQVKENRTLLTENKLKTLLIAESSTANEINCKLFFECKKSERINESETLQYKKEISDFASSTENQKIEVILGENNVKESNRYEAENDTKGFEKQRGIRKNVESFIKRSTRKQKFSEDEVLSSPDVKVTKPPVYSYPKAADGSELVSQNIRKSLTNNGKNSKYFENCFDIETNGIETYQFEKAEKKIDCLRVKKFEDSNGMEKQQLNKFTTCVDGAKNTVDGHSKTLQRVNDYKTSPNKDRNQQSEQELEKNSEKDKIPKTDALSMAKKCLTAQIDTVKSASQRRLRSSKNVLSRKQQLCFRVGYITRQNLRSKDKVLRYLMRARRRYRRRYLVHKTTRGDSNTASLANSEILRENLDKPETREISYEALSSITEKHQEEINCCPSEEISISLNKNDVENVVEQTNSVKVCPGKETSIKSNFALVYGENMLSAKESGKANKIAAKEYYEEQAEYCSEIERENLIQKATLNTQYVNGHPKEDAPATLEAVNSSSINALIYPSPTPTEPISPLSPKTEEEHFEFYAPKKKLNKEHISHLIKLYQGHPRLWDQSHADFCEPEKCRKSWQQLTEAWNHYCQRKFSIAEVRIRVCTLCQRFVQEKDRLALEGELDECAKFPYYEQMKFLEHQKSLRKRRELYEQQNEKILEIYQHFPILWHVRHYKTREASRRAEAFESISKVLKLFGLHLSSLGVQKRIRSLRKCYRLEKIRYLHAQVEKTAFETEFRHYERMQFLDKHIDPFVCRICGKIFENLQGFREHLEAENHGSICQQDTDNENIFGEEDKPEEYAENFIVYSAACSPKECYAESEKSTDILQRFTPFPATPQSTLERNYSEELHCFSLNTSNDLLSNSWQYEDQLIEEIMDHVGNDDKFNQHGIDQFINSVASCEQLTNGHNLFEEILSPSLLTAENSYIVEHPDIISDRTGSLLSPLTNTESLISVGFGPENSLMVENCDLMTEHNFSVPLPADETVVVATEAFVEQPDEEVQPDDERPSPFEELGNQVMAEAIAEKPSSSTALLVKVQCADYSVNLKLNTETLPTLDLNLPQDTDHELYSSGDNTIAPLPDCVIRKMIELYRKFPQLWDPNHLDFNSRTLRRQAWIQLTQEFNALICKKLSWRTLHRKLTDYAKYYKKLVADQAHYENLINKWIFYEDFKFLNDVIAVNTELQRSVHHRDNNFKIISTYKTFPQLWNIKHPDFSRRSNKQRNFELMCNRLQEENNLQLTTERLKNRLIELRAQYRMAKKQRLKCLKNQQPFTGVEFEFYEALKFLDDHIDPFVCDKCKIEFKKLTDYNQHLKKEHAQKKRIILPPAVPGMENVCHICGTKFTTRSNLLHHIKRHEGIRNYACTMCPKKFYASHALKVHTRSHTKECPYTCEKCGLSFVSASKLNQHVKRHLNQKDFECNYCPKTFFTAFEKERHERRHLNIRDKICPICGKTFVAGSSYYAHLMLHSDTKRFECDKCDMKFAQYPGLFKHKKRHHK